VAAVKKTSRAAELDERAITIEQLRVAKRLLRRTLKQVEQIEKDLTVARKRDRKATPTEIEAAHAFYAGPVGTPAPAVAPACRGCAWEAATAADAAIGSGDEPAHDYGDGPGHTCRVSEPSTPYPNRPGYRGPDRPRCAGCAWEAATDPDGAGYDPALDLAAPVSPPEHTCDPPQE
jgi:hypothetical protein